MQVSKRQLTLGGATLFLSGVLLGGYVVWSHHSNAQARDRMMRMTTKSKQIFFNTDAPQPTDSAPQQPD